MYPSLLGTLLSRMFPNCPLRLRICKLQDEFRPIVRAATRISTEVADVTPIPLTTQPASVIRTVPSTTSLPLPQNRRLLSGIPACDDRLCRRPETQDRFSPVLEYRPALARSLPLARLIKLCLIPRPEGNPREIAYKSPGTYWLLLFLGRVLTIRGCKRVKTME